MLKVYKTLNPVERKTFFDNITTEMNRELQSGITKIENSAGFKFGPNFLNNFLTKNRIGKLMFGLQHLNGTTVGVCKTIAHMYASAFVIEILDTIFQGATLTKGEKKVNGIGDKIKNLISGDDLNDNESIGNKVAKFTFNHLVPFVSIIVQSFQATFHAYEMFASNFGSYRKDMSNNSDNKTDTETDTKQSAIEKGKDKLLETFKSSLSKVEPKILDKYLNNITVEGNELILTDNGTVYEIHYPLRGKNAYIVEDGEKYQFTNKMFTE